MSWSVSKVIGSTEDVVEMRPEGVELGARAEKQLRVARECAIHLLRNLEGGTKFNVSLSGHAERDTPGSSGDAISVSVSVAEKGE